MQIPRSGTAPGGSAAPELERSAPAHQIPAIIPNTHQDLNTMTLSMVRTDVLDQTAIVRRDAGNDALAAGGCSAKAGSMERLSVELNAELEKPT